MYVNRNGKIRNNIVRETLNNKNSVLDCLKYKQLNWHVHVPRMNKESVPQKILELCPPGRRRRRRRRRRKGRSRNSWMQEVTTGMRGKGIKNLGWIKKEEWRRKLS